MCNTFFLIRCWEYVSSCLHPSLFFTYLLLVTQEQERAGMILLVSALIIVRLERLWKAAASVTPVRPVCFLMSNGAVPREGAGSSAKPPCCSEAVL